MKALFNKFWPFLCMIILWTMFSYPYFAKGLVPFPSTYLVTFFPPWNATYGMPVKNNAMPDTISQIYPWKKLTIDSWKSGQVPLWNPYSFSGTPHAANYQSAVFSPMNLLFFILPFVDAWSMLILFQPLLAGIGTYMFLRAIERSKTASLLGAIAFMFCGFMTTWMAYGTLGYAAAFLPWALWAVACDFHKKSFFSRLALVCSIALSLLSGHFQISLYVCVATVVYILYTSVVSGNTRHGLVLMFYTLLGLLLAFPQILLTADAYMASVRSGSFVKGEIIPWRYLITLFSPDFYGNPVTRNDWFGHYAEWASYVGVLPLVLSLFAIRGKIKGDKLLFILLGAAALLLAYPTPVSDLLYFLKLPALSTSAASRVILLLSFSLAALCSFGVDDLIDCWKTKRMKDVIVFVVAVLLVIGVIWGIILIGKPFVLDKLVIAKRNLTLPTVFALSALALMITGFIKNRFFRYGILVCFIVIAAFDSYRYAAKWMPFESRSYMYPQDKSLTYLQSLIGVNRMFGNVGNEINGVYKLPLIEGYDAMYQGRYAEFINAASSGHPDPGDRSVVQFDKYGLYRSEALQLLGVRYIYHRLSDGRNIWAFPYWEYIEDGSMKQVYKDDNYWIYEYTKAYPRAYLASGYEIARGKQEIITLLFSKDFDRRETVVLEEKPDAQPQAGSGSAQITSYTANGISIQTDSAVPKLLFLSDAYDSGWKATVDGKPSKILRADYDFRAVEVPAGRHIVQFAYIPVKLISGIVVSFLALIVFFVSRRLL